MDQSPFGYRDVPASEKPALVRGVFDGVARRYDLMNDLMSGGLHRVWKDIAVSRMNPRPGDLVIDCAGGTGDMARRIKQRSQRAAQRTGGPSARVVVVDYTERMIAAGRGRKPFKDNAGIDWVVGDAQALPLPSGRADAYCIAFGLRNVTDITKALAEARRVLKPGGRFLCLEFTKPPASAVRRVYDAYSFSVIPRVGAAVARDRESYQYLVESIRRFPDQATLSGLMEDAGFSRVEATNLSGGVCALHQGWAISNR